MNESDETLYGRFRADKDEEAFRVLLERHKESLILFLNGYVHNLEDAEELMLDAYAEVAAGTAAYLGKSSFKTWLFAIGKKKALSHLRRERRFFMSQEPLPEDVQVFQPADFGLMQEESNRQLYQALLTLKDEYRQVLTLTYFEEMSCEELAKVLGKSKKQIYNLTERGRKALKEELERIGFDHS